MVAALFIGALVLVPQSAHAQASTCIDAHANGQREAKAGKLRLARQLFMSCVSDTSCPGVLRKECEEFLATVQSTIPTVIFSATDKSGQDLPTVKVYSGDEMLADGLDGRAVELDPGNYNFSFVLADGSQLTSQVLIREGDKRRLVQVKREPEAVSEVPSTKKEPELAQSTQEASRPSSTTPVERSIPVAFWAASATAVAGLGVGTTFAVLGSREKSDLSDCAPYCQESKRDAYSDLKRDYLIADIGFAVSAISAGVAVWSLVSAYSGEGEVVPSTAQTRVSATNLIPKFSWSARSTYVNWSGSF